MNNIMDLAKEYATKLHEGQFRRDGTTPYITHPENVARLLKKFGADTKTQVTGWLHDIIEDTKGTYEEINNTFGMFEADGVYILTRNVCEDEYKKRLEHSPYEIQLVKLCDLADNLRTLHALRPTGIERKIHDSETFYVPLAEKIKPSLAELILSRIEDYRTNYCEVH